VSTEVGDRSGNSSADSFAIGHTNPNAPDPIQALFYKRGFKL
jgi:hypothetical protein